MSSDKATRVSRLPSSLVSAYVRAVEENAVAVEKFEGALRSIILIMPAKLGLKSESSAQTVVSVVNLASVYNRLLILKSRAPTVALFEEIVPRAIPTLTWAAVVEHIALVSELLAKKYHGQRGRWCAIAAVETLRALLQLKLLYEQHGHMIVMHHLSQVLPHHAAILAEPPSRLCAQQPAAAAAEARPAASDAVTLQQSRWWQREGGSKSVPLAHVAGEVLYAVRPLVYLGLMYKFGTKSWRAWLGSAAIDIASRMLHGDVGHMSKLERAEMRRRASLWFLYLLRSPFYESAASNMMMVRLAVMVKKVPLLGMVVAVIVKFVALYRHHHFNLSLM